MPRRSGRPRTNLEEKILAEMSENVKQAAEIVAKTINLNTPSFMAFEAACLLLQIEAGAVSATIQRKPIFQKVNQFAKENGPHGKWPGPHAVRDFLEEFLSFHAPGWNYREEGRQGAIENRNYRRENERIAQEIAQDQRLSLALS